MLLIYIIVLAVLAMARKPQRRRRRTMGRYIRGNINLKFALGTLGAGTVLLGTPADVVEERTMITSVVARYSLSGYTGGDNIGPVAIGIAHSDYSLTEVGEWVALATGWAEGDKVSQEISNRLIRRIGIFDVEGGSAGEASTLNEGRPVKTKLNWILTTGQNVNFWVLNMGSAALATTDPDVNVQGHANLFPK